LYHARRSATIPGRPGQPRSYSIFHARTARVSGPFALGAAGSVVQRESRRLGPVRGVTPGPSRLEEIRSRRRACAMPDTKRAPRPPPRGLPGAEGAPALSTAAAGRCNRTRYASIRSRTLGERLDSTARSVEAHTRGAADPASAPRACRLPLEAAERWHPPLPGMRPGDPLIHLSPFRVILAELHLWGRTGRARRGTTAGAPSGFPPPPSA
jgi:hypothetical protein